jgi:hypothetical protein
MRLHEFAARRIAEGGNIFKDPAGQPLTQRIQRSEIEPTIRWMEEITRLPLVDNTLGSVGKKASSGDLDIAVDQNAITKDELVDRLTAWARSQGEDPKDWVRKSGVSVHFKTPIQGNPKLGFVQTDFMFGDDIEQMKFGLFSAGEASEFSGADRNLLMSSVAKSLPGDLKYSWQKGLIKRSTGELITKNPDEVAHALLGRGYDRSDLDSVETIMSAIKKDPKRSSGLKDQVKRLRDTEGKKAAEAKADAEEAKRIEAALKVAS